MSVLNNLHIPFMGYFFASVEMELETASSIVKTDCQNQKRGTLHTFSKLLISVLDPKSAMEESIGRIYLEHYFKIAL